MRFCSNGSEPYSRKPERKLLSIQISQVVSENHKNQPFQNFQRI